MSYLSLSFAGFTLALMLVFYTLPKKARWGVLLVGSLFFYTCFGLKYLPFLLFTALTTFFGAKFFKKTDKKKSVLVSVIALNVAVWFYIKELPWTFITLSRVFSVFGIPLTLPKISIIIPVGISYFILQAIAYVVDVMKGKTKEEENFFKYLLFLSWFPAIVQGPISRYDALMPQLLNTKKYSFESMRDNLVLILFGLIKKMVIADRLGIFVNSIFENYTDLRGVILYLGAVGYAIQLYTDFSGCVDICRGVSGLFGVNLINNFNRPYLSRSVSEFWGKWHISLSSWLKDYIYIPLGGNRKGTIRKYINLMLTFLVSGLWHGAGFNFLLWGAIHGTYQIIGRSTAALRLKAKAFMGVKHDSLSDKIYKSVTTFNLVTLGWIIFRSSGLMTGLDYIKKMFISPQIWRLFDGSLYEFGVNQNYMIFLIFHICILFAAELLTKNQEDVISGLNRQHIGVRWIVYLLMIFDVLLFGVYGSGYDMASFMYGGF